MQKEDIKLFIEQLKKYNTELQRVDAVNNVQYIKEQTYQSYWSESEKTYIKTDRIKEDDSLEYSFFIYYKLANNEESYHEVVLDYLYPDIDESEVQFPSLQFFDSFLLLRNTDEKLVTLSYDDIVRCQTTTDL